MLLLDEPTNHLDLRSKDILKRAIQEYEGTVIMVSHDRDFMQGICSRLFEFRDTRVKEHLCDIEGFVTLRTQERLQEQNDLKQKSKPPINTAAKTPQKTPASPSSETANKLKKIELQLETLENEIKAKEQLLQNPEAFSKLENTDEFFKSYEILKNTHERLWNEWESLSLPHR